MRAFFIGSIVLVVMGAGAYFFLARGTNGGARIIFKNPEKIVYGVPFEVHIGVGNNSSAVWHDVKLAVALPEGLLFAESNAGQSLIIKSLGVLGGGSLTDTSVQMIVPMVDGGVSHRVPVFEARVSYTPEEAGGTVFEKKETWEGILPEQAVSLALTAPENIVAGEEIKIELQYENVTDADVDNLVLTIEYPPSFMYSKASSEPDATKKTWAIGSLKKGSSDHITIFGSLKQAASAEFIVTIARDTGKMKIPMSAARAIVAVGEAPIFVGIDVNDASDYVARLGETLNYAIGYTLDKAPQAKNITVRARLTGSLFDLATLMVNDNGIFYPHNNEIIWYPDDTRAEGGAVGFSIKTKSDYGIRRLGDRNFILKVGAEVKTENIISTAERETKVAGQTLVAGQGYYRDADSGVVNKGSLPPRVGFATHYTIHWVIKNYATDVKNIVARASLPPGVTFTGTVKSNIDSKPTYSADTNEMIWKIDRISATTGVIGRAPEAIFQISATPTVDMTGKYMPLVGAITLTALDDFTNITLTATAMEITTALPDDPTVVGQGIVIQ